MLVKYWMKQQAVTIEADESMEAAVERIKENAIQMLPVMEKGRLVGVITDRDLKRASASDATSLEIHELLYLLTRIKVRDIMSKKPVTVPEDYTIEETAEVLLKHNISGAPVIDANSRIVGIITKSDIFRALISLTGVGKRGIQFAFQIQDRPGSIKELTDIIRAHGGRLASILSTYARVPEGLRKVYIRMYGIERKDLNALEDKLREKAAMLYMVDHVDNKRKIYEVSNDIPQKATVAAAP
jgi:acetoin utilization protein AcuB